jgi:hypothetical protein
MHVEILVEDLSGKKALDILVPRIIRGQDTFRVHFYRVWLFWNDAPENGV